VRDVSRAAQQQSKCKAAVQQLFREEGLKVSKAAQGFGPRHILHTHQPKHAAAEQIQASCVLQDDLHKHKE
jgi:hypothetical protein